VSDVILCTKLINKGRGKFVTVFNYALRQEAIRGEEVYIRILSTTALDRDDYLHAPAALPPVSNGKVGTIVDRDDLGERKTSYFCQESNFDSSVVQPVA
jgi:hypothetical protein